MKLNKDGIAVMVAATMNESYKPTPLTVAIVSYVEVVAGEIERYALTYASDLEITFPRVRKAAAESIVDLSLTSIAEVEETAGAILYSYWDKHGESYYRFLRTQQR
jgi:hypothetical protein